MNEISRRAFGKTLAAAAAVTGTSLPRSSFAEQTGKPAERAFPRGFVWGCATAAYQIEGGATADGRGPSVWDVFSHTPGKTHNGDTGDVADDSYHLYKEDVRLLKNLGVGGYRMSFSWPRIFPEGKGAVNPKGLDYYSRVIDELLANGITPYITLFHWDLPAALPGGWQSRDTAKAFADYAGYVTKHFSDRVHNWMTINEFTCFTDLGYREGRNAPGLKLPAAEANQVRHNGILAHGLGLQAIRANTPAGTRVGLAENASVFVPVMETEEHIRAAQKATREGNAAFLAVLMEGKYPQVYLDREGANAPKVEPGDLEVIAGKVDFVGLNVYTGDYVRADDSPRGFAVLPRQASYPHMASPWINVTPECTYWTIRNVTELWHPPAIFITENGCSAEDVVRADGAIDDTERVMYLRNHIANVQRAAAEGYPIEAYFLWSLLDNFEWGDGYSKRFGIHYVDYQTLKRTPKLSAKWYGATIRRNAVV